MDPYFIVTSAVLLAAVAVLFWMRTRRLLRMEIAERARAEDALRESREKLQLATNSMPTLVAFIGNDLRYRFANEAYCQWSGMPVGKIVGKTIREVWGPQMFQTVRQQVESTVSGEEVDFETTLPLKDGGQLTVHARLVPNRTEDGVDGFFVLATDITQLRQTEQELRISRDALRNLTGRLMTVQEAERRRVARELHDDITQRLAALTMDAASVKQKLDGLSESHANLLDDLTDKIGRISQDVHHISRQLHPSILEDLGLVEAIRSECKALSDRGGVDVEFDPELVRDKLSNEQELCLYRVAQESLRNVAKHARTRSALVRIRQDDGEVCLYVEDGGVGFDRGSIGRSGGIGLVTMEERVNLCGGSFVVESKPGGGTKLVVRMSVQRQS